MTTRVYFQVSSVVPPSVVALAVWVIPHMDSPPQWVNIAFIYGLFGLVLGLLPYGLVLYLVFTFLSERLPRAYILGALLTPILCGVLISPLGGCVGYLFNELQPAAAGGAVHAFLITAGLGYLSVLTSIALYAVLARSGHIRDYPSGRAAA